MMSGNIFQRHRLWRHPATKGAPVACVFLLMAVYATLGVSSTRWTGPATTLMVVAVWAVSLMLVPWLSQWQDHLEFSRWRSRPNTGTVFEKLATATMLALMVFCIVAVLIDAPAPWLPLAATWTGAIGFGWLAIRRNPGLR